MKWQPQPQRLLATEVTRVPIMFAEGLNTAEIRDVFQAERERNGWRGQLHEWQVYNCLARYRRQARAA